MSKKYSFEPAEIPEGKSGEMAKVFAEAAKDLADNLKSGQCVKAEIGGYGINTIGNQLGKALINLGIREQFVISKRKGIPYVTRK